MIAFGVLEKVDHFAEFVDGFFDAGDVVEGDFNIFLSDQLAAAAAEGHRRTGPAHAAEHDDHQHDEHAGEDQHGDVGDQLAWLFFVAVVGDFVFGEQFKRASG